MEKKANKTNKFIQDNIIWFIIVIAVIVGCLAWDGMSLVKLKENIDNVNSQKELLQSKQSQLEQIRTQKKQAEQVEKKTSKSGKVIYEVLGQQFSPEASFGIMFENVLSNVTGSGLRIRSIDYNYQPADDEVLLANAPGYNACELKFKTVGTYSQLQTFLKNITRENYLTNIHELYIEPYDKDKSILIATFSIRLYTKTI